MWNYLTLFTCYSELFEVGLFYHLSVDKHMTDASLDSY